MRVAIRELLINGIDTINNKVYEPSAAGPELEKPYLILREGVQSENDPYKDFTTVYEVWPYVKRTTFQNVDSLSKKVIETLHRKRFDVKSVPHYIEYTGTITEDIVDEEWGALTRGLRFQVFSLAWLLHTPIHPDPVEAMKDWTERHFIGMQTNPLHWSPADETPALYWRVSNINSMESTNWGAWITATLRGHVIIPDVAERGRWLDLIVRQLALSSKTNMSDGSKMTFQSVIADGSYDPFGVGQIALNVRFGILQPELNFEKIKNISLDPIPGGVVGE